MYSSTGGMFTHPRVQSYIQFHMKNCTYPIGSPLNAVAQAEWLLPPQVHATIALNRLMLVKQNCLQITLSLNETMFPSRYITPQVHATIAPNRLMLVKQHNTAYRSLCHLTKPCSLPAILVVSAQNLFFFQFRNEIISICCTEVLRCDKVFTLFCEADVVSTT